MQATSQLNELNQVRRAKPINSSGSEDQMPRAKESGGTFAVQCLSSLSPRSTRYCRAYCQSVDGRSEGRGEAERRGFEPGASRRDSARGRLAHPAPRNHHQERAPEGAAVGITPVSRQHAAHGHRSSARGAAWELGSRPPGDPANRGVFSAQAVQPCYHRRPFGTPIRCLFCVLSECRVPVS